MTTELRGALDELESFNTYGVLEGTRRIDVVVVIISEPSNLVYVRINNSQCSSGYSDVLDPYAHLADNSSLYKSDSASLIALLYGISSIALLYDDDITFHGICLTPLELEIIKNLP